MKLIQERNYDLLLRSAWQRVFQNNTCRILTQNTPCIPIHFPCYHTNHTLLLVQIKSSYWTAFLLQIPWNQKFQSAFSLKFRILCTLEPNLAIYKFYIKQIFILQFLRNLAVTIWIVDIYYTLMQNSWSLAQPCHWTVKFFEAKRAGRKS